MAARTLAQRMADAGLPHLFGALDMVEGPQTARVVVNLLPIEVARRGSISVALAAETPDGVFYGHRRYRLDEGRDPAREWARSVRRMRDVDAAFIVWDVEHF